MGVATDHSRDAHASDTRRRLREFRKNLPSVSCTSACLKRAFGECVQPRLLESAIIYYSFLPLTFFFFFFFSFLFSRSSSCQTLAYETAL